VSSQTYETHRKYDPLFHFVTTPLLVLTLIGAIINLFKSFDDHSRLYNASLILMLTVILTLVFFFARIFALKAQDRAIRAEENLRHYVLTGKLLDAKLTALQVVALRFACDAEFCDLASRAASQGMAPDDIKKSIKTWRPDEYRV
jgi:hypothetical protein